MFKNFKLILLLSIIFFSNNYSADLKIEAEKIEKLRGITKGSNDLHCFSAFLLYLNNYLTLGVMPLNYALSEDYNLNKALKLFLTDTQIGALRENGENYRVAKNDLMDKNDNDGLDKLEDEWKQKSVLLFEVYKIVRKYCIDNYDNEYTFSDAKSICPNLEVVANPDSQMIAKPKEQTQKEKDRVVRLC